MSNVFIPKDTKVSVKAHHGGIAIGVLAQAYEPGREVNLKEFISPIPAKVVKAVTRAEDWD